MHLFLCKALTVFGSACSSLTFLCDVLSSTVIAQSSTFIAHEMKQCFQNRVLPDTDIDCTRDIKREIERWSMEHDAKRKRKR